MYKCTEFSEDIIFCFVQNAKQIYKYSYLEFILEGCDGAKI